jgi:low affinity Fe/Cu permease
MNDAFGRFARRINTVASHPLATVAAALFVLAWALAGPHLHYSDMWQLVMNTVSSVVTFLMVFILNNAQSRDTAAINAKLDTIILAIEAADNRLLGLENKPDSAARAVLEDLATEIEAAESPALAQT